MSRMSQEELLETLEKTERTRGGRSMKKIGQVFLYDISHIKKTLIAMIVVLGLCVVPSLYAWFNIAESRGSILNDVNGLKVAVCKYGEGV